MLQAIPVGRSIGLGRSLPTLAHQSQFRRVDLDRKIAPLISLPDDYVVVYTVPPSLAERDALKEIDTRLQAFVDATSRRPSRFVYLVPVHELPAI